MKCRALGKTNILVSEVGFGCWGIGGATPGATSYGSTVDETSIHALRFAFDNGLRFFDTADIYGYGRSESLIGKALGDVRQELVLASKVGFVEHNGPQCFSAKYITEHCEESLLRLRTDYLDVYQLHNPDIQFLEKNDEAITALENLQRQGKIRSRGISVRSPQDTIRAIALGFEVIQINFNMIDQRVLNSEVVAAIQNAGVGVIVRTPLCFGFLSGKYQPESVFASNDHRSSWSSTQRALWAEAHKVFPILGEQTPVQFALRYCLSYDWVSTVIPGMLTNAHVSENIMASTMGVLDGDVRLSVEQAYRNHQFFLGK